MADIAAKVDLVAYCGLYCGACIAQIKRLGLEGHAGAMAASGAHTIKRSAPKAF